MKPKKKRTTKSVKAWGAFVGKGKLIGVRMHKTPYYGPVDVRPVIVSWTEK